MKKLEEARIAAREENGILRVGSYAAVPERLTGPRTMCNTVLAGLAGGLLTRVVILFVEYWHDSKVSVQDN
ncbi:MAG: hypothetical protein PVI80_23070 [Anaerolineae bacterium]|jgi:uncharacterized protein involved in exopolysaccharide biosynthesis